MNCKLPYTLLSRLSRVLAIKIAFHFPEDRWEEMELKAVAIAKDFGYTDMEEFTSYLETNRLNNAQVKYMASHLTIGETYFWREPQIFEALQQEILPALIQQKKDKRLRIWCAGCSSGEEPYSIAIVLRRLLPDIKDWNIMILATDINAEVLKKANKGVYGRWSFRNVPSWLLENYFNQLPNDQFEILPAIRKMVSFNHLNLADDNFPSAESNTNALDLIFCRNVIMYFTSDLNKQVVNNFYKSLSDDAWLIVSSSELSQQLFSAFSSFNFSGAIVYRKQALAATQALHASRSGDVQQKRIVPDLLKPIPPKKKFVHLENRNMVSKRAGNPRPSKEEMIPEIRSLANQGKLTEALAKCEEALVGNKLNSGLHFLSATIHQELNQFSKAIASLNTALYLDPNFIMAYFTLGNIFQKQGDKPHARKSFENVLAILTTYKHDDMIPEAEGLTAGRLKEIVKTSI